MTTTTTTDPTTTRWAVLTEHPHDPDTATLTPTQRSALDTLRTGRHGLWPDAPYRQRTLNALVLAGHAVWRGSVFETPCRHGVMPHVVLLDRESSGSRQSFIETGLYLTRDEAAEYATEPVDDSSAGNYYTRELDTVLAPADDPDPDAVYRLKVTGDRGETKWLRVTPTTIAAIRAALAKQPDD